MKHIAQYKIFESDNLNKDLTKSQIELKDSILDIFMDIKDEWNIENLDNGDWGSQPFGYKLVFAGNTTYFYLKYLFIQFKDDIREEMIKKYFNDCRDFEKRLQRMGLDVYSVNLGGDYIKMEIKEK